MEKFTPGPWTVERTSQTPNRLDDFISSESGAVAWSYSIKPANGQLIAAAPDMYDALVIAVGIIKEICHVRNAPLPAETISRLESALKKARGEE